MTERDDKRIRDLIETGSDIAGGAAGASLGFMIGGPTGAITGGAGGPAASRAFRHLAVEFTQRVLGQREKERIGATMDFAAEKIRMKLEAGCQVRGDGFFEEEPGDRPAAEEVLEGVLLAAQREPQEKKLRFYGNLIANIAFHPEIDRDQAAFLVSLGESLSYRQLCLLRLFAAGNAFKLKQTDYRGGGLSEADRVAVVQEIYDLYSRGLLGSGGEALLGVTDVAPAKMTVQGVAATLHNLMELSAVPVRDLSRIARWLQ